MDNVQVQSKPRVRVSWLSKNVWLCRFANGLVTKLERTKTGLIRVRAIYFSCKDQNKIAAKLAELSSVGKFKADRRDSKYCNAGNQEYRISATVAIMKALEEKILRGFLLKQSAKNPGVVAMPIAA